MKRQERGRRCGAKRVRPRAGAEPLGDHDEVRPWRALGAGEERGAAWRRRPDRWGRGVSVPAAGARSCGSERDGPLDLDPTVDVAREEL